MSETTNLKLFKHDNPSTNTNPFDVEQALNDNWDKLDTAVKDLQDDVEENNTNIDTRLTELETDLGTAKTDITNIKAEQTTQNNNIEANSTAIETNAEAIEQNKEDITDLQAENANLKAQIPTGQESREEISLSDSAEMELVDFGLQGNSRQETREGYNLIQASNEFRKGNAGSGITGSVTDEGYLQVVAEEGNANYINSFWSLNSQNSMAKVKEILKAGDTFTIAFTIKRTEGTSAAPRVYIKENTAYKGMTGTVTTEFKQVYYTGVWEEGNDISIIHLGFASLTGTFIIKDWLVKKGDLADWEDYGAKPSLDYSSEVQAVGDSGSVEIVKSNKNILDFGNQTGNGITYNKNRITLNNPTGFLYSTNNNIGGNKFLFGKTLIFSLRANGEITGNNMAQFIVHSNKRQYLVTVNYSKKSYVNAISTVKVTLADDERIGSVQVYTAGTTGNLTIDVQVEIADGATDIIEHEGNTYTIPIQNPFYKIGDYADGFIKQNKWYEQHYIKEVIFTGTENWQLSSNQFRTFYRDIYNTSNGIANINDAATNYFKYQYTPREDIQAFDLANLNAAKNYAAFRVCVSNSSEITTVEEWKAKLQELNTQGNPLKLYYVLNTPELIECTSEQTQILEQIVKDGTYKGKTHFYTTEDLKPTLEVKYYKDLETLFKNQASMQETLDNVQAQLLEIGG